MFHYIQFKLYSLCIKINCLKNDHRIFSLSIFTNIFFSSIHSLAHHPYILLLSMDIKIQPKFYYVLGSVGMQEQRWTGHLFMLLHKKVIQPLFSFCCRVMQISMLKIWWVSHSEWVTQYIPSTIAVISGYKAQIYPILLPC